MFSDPNKNIAQFQIGPGMKVVDLGSGSGFYSLAIASEVGDMGRVIAVDVQKDLLTKLKNEGVKRGLHNLDVVWGDIDEVKGSTLVDSLADRVLIANTLFQVENKDNIIKEARRILKPNGKLLLIDWSESFGGLGPAPDHVVLEEEAKKICAENGFELEKKIDAGTHHYGFIFKKV